MGKNIVRTIFKPEQPKVNELFIAGRMAYVMDLEEEVVKSMSLCPFFYHLY